MTQVEIATATDNYTLRAIYHPSRFALEITSPEPVWSGFLTWILDIPGVQHERGTAPGTTKFTLPMRLETAAATARFAMTLREHGVLPESAEIATKRLPDDVTIRDATRALSQVEHMFAAARQLTTESLFDPVEYLSEEPETAPWPATASPRLLKLRMASPLEILAQIPPEYLASGGTGIAALLALVTRMAVVGRRRSGSAETSDGPLMQVVTFKVRVSERMSHFRLEQARLEDQLDELDLRRLQRTAEFIRAETEIMQLQRLEILDPDDTQQLLETGESPLNDDAAGS